MDDVSLKDGSRPCLGVYIYVPDETIKKVRNESSRVTQGGWPYILMGQQCADLLSVQSMGEVGTHRSGANRPWAVSNKERMVTEKWIRYGYVPSWYRQFCIRLSCIIGHLVSYPFTRRTSRTRSSSMGLEVKGHPESWHSEWVILP